MMDIKSIRYLAEDMIEDLREMKDGESTSTYQLFSEYGYANDEFDSSDLFALHKMIFHFAGANHIKLDMSAHEGLDEGLPYNLDYVVHNKKAQIKCPRCGSTNTARYLYGMPAFSEKMEKMLDEKKWTLGGCCISSVEINGKHIDIMPERKCNDCKKDFATAPVLMASGGDSAEDYRDIVTAIKFSIGGFFGGYTDILIKKNSKGAAVSVCKSLSIEPEQGIQQISTLKWQKIVNTLYGELYLHEWKKNYVDPYVLDGTQWNLDISLTNRRKRSYSGSNDYPPYWNELLKIFRKFTKI